MTVQPRVGKPGAHDPDEGRDHASRRLLLTAAESGKRTDIGAATNQIERLLRARQLLSSGRANSAL